MSDPDPENKEQMKRTDDTLRRMLKTPPKPHKPKDKSDKKRPAKPNK